MLDYLMVGVLAGIITGVLPGLHANTISFFILLSDYNDLNILFFTVGMLVSHNFFDFLPSIFLSAPEEGTSLSVSVGKKWLLKGKGWEAIRITSIGCLTSLILSALLSPALILFLPWLHNNFHQITGLLLGAISLHLLLREKKFWRALTIFLLAGVLGFITLKNYLIPHPLMALLTGLFGMSSLIESIKNKARIPEQIKVYGNELTRKELITGSLKGSLSSIILGFVPAIGPSQASLLVDDSQKSDEELLAGLGGVNTSDIVMSVIAMLSINKARSGALEVVQQKIVLSPDLLTSLMFSCLVAGVASFCLLRLIGPRFTKALRKINYQKTCVITLVMLCVIITLFNGWAGLLIAGCGALIGLLAKNVRKSQLMGALIMPTLHFFFFSS